MSKPLTARALFVSMLVPFAFAIPAKAEGGGQLAIPVALSIAVEASLPTCDEDTRDAYFEAQRKLTDGDVTPIPSESGRCKRQMHVAETE